MNKRKPNRKRNKAVTVRMTEEEYLDLQKKVFESGLTEQAYVISAVQGAVLTTAEEIEIQKEISLTFNELTKQLRGLASNVNQMAHVANSLGTLPTLEELSRTSKKISDYRMESEILWQSIRSSISQHVRTVR